MSHKNPQRVTVVTGNFITLFNGLVLRRSAILSLQSTISWSLHDWPARDQQLAQNTHLDCMLMARPAMLKTHVHSILKPRLH